MDNKEGRGSKLIDKRIILLCLTHGVNHGTLLFFTTALLMIASDLNINYAEVGALVTFAYIAYGVGQLPTGIVSDFLGRKNTILASLLIPAAGALLGALSTSYGTLAISFVLVGIGGSCYHPSAYAFISDISAESDRGKAFAWHGIGSNIGSALTPMLAGVVCVALGWKAIFFVWAVICIINAVAIIIMMPQDARRFTVHKSSDNSDGKKKNAWKELLTATILIGLFIYAIQGFVNDGIFAYLPTLLQDDFTIAVTASGIITGIQYGGGIFGQLLGGYLSDKWNRMNIILIASIGFVVMTCAMLILGKMSGIVMLTLIMFLMGFFLFMLQPPINAVFSKLVPASIMGSSFGLVFVCKYGLGAFAPALGAIVAQISSLTVFFYILAGIMIIGIVLSLILKARLVQTI
ncbi:MAG: MFS transporter [Gracilibacteraceae bacterium]|nr:MFS transporter [Gracilibacteraceae bacterium]